MSNDEVDAIAKLFGWTIEAKRSPNSKDWVYVIEHEGGVRLIDWNNSSKEMAIKRGTKHMRGYLIQRYKLGEQHGI